MPKDKGGVHSFLRSGGDWLLSAKAEGSLTRFKIILFFHKKMYNSIFVDF